MQPDPCSECAYESDHGEREQGAELCWAVPPADPRAPADPRLDVYRSRYAKVFDDDEDCGFLATFVQTWWTAEGPWWRRRWTNPRQLPHWIWADGVKLRDDGVVGQEDLDREFVDWDRGRFAYQGRYLRLEWLTGPEADAVRRYFAG
jgi:hypothetical protein